MNNTINTQKINKEEMFIYFSQLMDRPVIDSGGELLGRVYDIVVKPTEVYPQSALLIIRKGFPNRKYAVVNWTDIFELDTKETRLKIDKAKISFSEILNN